MAQRIVGLDIGTSAIRAVELTVDSGRRPTLLAYGQVGLAPGMVVDGEIRDTNGVINAIRRLWTEGGFNEDKVVIGVAGLRAITRELDMPTLPPDELDNAVRFQADEVVPFPMERTAISSKVIAQFAADDGTPTIRVLVAAAHRDLIDSVVAVAIGAGLEPVGIDLNTAAVVRSLHDPSFSGGPEAIISVGAGLTLVVVHENGILQFVRTIDLAGESITRAIASSLDLPMSDAEAIKRRLGEEGAADARAITACEQSVGELVNEVHNSIRFFSSLPGRSPVARVLVTGAGARVAGFFQGLQDGLDVPVLPASPLAFIDTSQLPITPEQAAAINPTLAVPVGLATPEPTGRQFNLLPEEVIKAAAQKKLFRKLAMAGLILLVLIVGLTVVQILRENGAKHQVTTLQATNANIQNVQIPKYDKAVQLQKSVVAFQEALKPVLSNVLDMLSVLNQLSLYQPTYAYYTSVSITGVSTGAAPVPGGTPTLGTVSAQVTVPTGSQAASWAQALAPSPALVTAPEVGALPAATSAGVIFGGTMTVTSKAASSIGAELTNPVTPPATKGAT